MNNSLTDAYAPIRAQLKRVDQILNQSINSPARLIPRVSRHLMKSGGKRIRPALLLASANACGHRGSQLAYTLAAAVELLHTATLLHDDVVDGSQNRRGRPAAHTIYGNAASILVGDYILAQAVSLVLKGNNLEVARPLAEVTVKLSEGEALQLTRKGSIPTNREYLSVITNKTALLFSAACKMGAMIAKANQPLVEALADYGLNFGIAFQLIDDCLDYLPEAGKSGKDWGRDLNEGKVTLPLLHTLSLCSRQEREKIHRLIQTRARSNSNPPLKPQVILSVKNLIQKYGGFKHTQELAQHYTIKAKSCLKALLPPPRRQLLENLADLALHRQN